MNIKSLVGSAILVMWLLFCLWAGTTLVIEYGEAMFLTGINLPAFMLLWVLVIFLGRFAIVWLIDKLWRSS
jgi:hypothetical protein